LLQRTRPRRWRLSREDGKEQPTAISAGQTRCAGRSARGHFPNEQAALKYVYLAVMSLDLTGTRRKRWMMRWKPALNAFEIAFDGRLAVGRN
jgi:hypothetical protein